MIINKDQPFSGEKFPPNQGWNLSDETSHDFAIVILQVRSDAERDGRGNNIYLNMEQISEDLGDLKSMS